MLGVGAGAYAPAIAPYSRAIVSHNVPLGLLVEQGIVGFERHHRPSVLPSRFRHVAALGSYYGLTLLVEISKGHASLKQFGAKG